MPSEALAWRIIRPAIVVYGLAAWVVWFWLEQIGDDGLGSFDPDRRGSTAEGLRRAIARGILTVWFLVNVLSFVNFPWVHPFDQPARGSDILENRLEMVENPDAFTDEQRARARGGVIVEPDADGRDAGPNATPESTPDATPQEDSE
jgi:hypothetical protein